MAYTNNVLCQVNGYRLLGINHMEVVTVLKELPIKVRMVCGRNIASQDPLCPIDTAQHHAAFQSRVRFFPPLFSSNTKINNIETHRRVYSEDRFRTCCRRAIVW